MVTGHLHNIAQRDQSSARYQTFDSIGYISIRNSYLTSQEVYEHPQTSAIRFGYSRWRDTVGL